MTVRRLAIVPARGGSKRILDKNIRPFCGRPMIAHILDAARRSDLFDVIHVSTDSARIAEIASAHGFAPQFPRPAALADDTTPLMPVLRYVTETFAAGGQTFDEVWLLMACAPLTEADDLRSAARLLTSTQGDKAVLAITPYPAPIEWAFDRAADGTLAPVSPGKFAVRSQDLATRFYDSGVFCGFPVGRVLQSEGAGDDAGYVGYVLARHKAIDIDTEEDWLMAEMLLAGRRSTPE